MRIRDAVPADAGAACDVLRRSIAELCMADHGGDPAILEAWLANKTPEALARWIGRPEQVFLLAEDGDGRLLGVAAMTPQGEILLDYVAPEARFRGVSRALLAALEARAAALGLDRCTLNSTETARRFYLAAGYAEEGAASGAFGTASGIPMAKTLPR